MSDPARAVVLHGHFYQPPRENPWLEAIPREPDAAPFHDWNERITAECYAANASANRLDRNGAIAEIVNNYRHISFNFGPTLIGYLERAAPETYAAILAADRESTARLGGHGNGLAQAYNHVILPLATPRDRRTQVRWGLADFAWRFGRAAEGLWLPETAVDVDTLEVLAEEGVRYTVLAPHQARRVRPLPPARTAASGWAAPGAEDGEPEAAVWRDVSDGSIDPRRPYLCRLPSGREIALFFYDGPLARGVAFDGLLHSGDAFADRIAAGFDHAADGAQLVHLATDGESYGHHHRHGEMALAAALARLAEQGIPTTSYGAFLAAHPPRHEVEVAERTAWSCAHGVERWRSNCGCHTGGGHGWNQEWRVGLRRALDALAASLDPWYEERAGALVRDPWQLRDDLGRLLPDDARRGLREVISANARRPLDEAETSVLARLLEIQRARLLMFTSCGWFFDELTGIEGTQILRYAARAIGLAEEIGFAEPPTFLEHLATARSNVPARGTGADFYREHVRVGAVGSRHVALAVAIERLVGARASVVRTPPFSARVQPRVDVSSPGLAAGVGATFSRAALGAARLLVAEVRVRDERTLADDRFVVAATRSGFDVTGAARAMSEGPAGPDLGELAEVLERAFERRALGTMVAEIARRLGPEFYGLDVLGLLSRAAYFPAVVSDLAALVAARLAEFEPLARSIAREAKEVGAAVPPAITAMLEATASLSGGGDEADLLVVLHRLEGAVTGGAGATRHLDAATAEIERLLAVRGESAHPFSIQRTRATFWWRILARTDLAADLDTRLGRVRERLGFAPEAVTAGAAAAAFGSLLRESEEAVVALREASGPETATPATMA